MTERAYFQGVQDRGKTCSLKIVCEGNVALLGLFSHPGKTNVSLKLVRLLHNLYSMCRREMGIMSLWAAATSFMDCAMASVCLHTFPHIFH